MFSRIFIRRPILASVLSIVIVIVGGVAMATLPIARYPQIAPPTVEVKAIYPGANAETVAETVATPIEQEVNGVENMAYMSSVSSADGGMTLTITFEVGTDVDMANVLVQNRVSTAQSKLPQEVMRQGLTTKKKSNEITLFVALFSPEGRYDAVFLNNYVLLYLRDEIARINGVGDVVLFGAGEYGMRIWLDPERLKTRGLTTNDVVAAIQDQNVQVAAGQIGEPPAPAGTAFQYTINLKGRLVSVEEFENIVVRTGAKGQLTLVKDIARVELGSKSYIQDTKFNGGPACAIGIYQLPGANAIEVSSGVRARLDELSRAFPEGLEVAVAFDSTDVIRASIKEVVVTLFITLALVVFTVYVFLQNFRATLIPSLTIPVALIGTFAVMAVLGFSINQLSLFGLVLVIGIVVDDAIVVVENTSRHLDAGVTDSKRAAELAMQEVTGPVIATTLVLLAVFVPTIFLPGITGRLFQQFAVTISVATVFSSINALTLSPALCGVLLRPTPKKQFIAFRLFNTALERTTSFYVGMVRSAIRLAVVGLLVFGGMIGLSIVGFASLPTGFVPPEDEGWGIVNIRLPDGASMERSIAVTDRAAKFLQGIEGVVNVLTISGFSIIDGANASNTGTIIMTLEPWDDRTDPAMHQRAITRRINAGLAQIQEGLAIAFVPPSLPGLGNAGGFAMQLQDRGGGGLGLLEQVANEFVDDGNAQAGLTSLYSGFRANVPQLLIEIDREQVRSMGLPLQDVFDTLQAALGSKYVNDFTLFGRIYQVRVQADSRFRATPEDIEKLEVRGPSGGMIPLGALLDVHEVLGPQVVTHHNLYASAKITGQPAPGSTSGDALALLANMADQKLPVSMGFEWTELSYQESQASGQAALIFLFSVLLVYLVLAAQYESWTIPIGICLTVPTALLGAVAALMLRGIDNNLYTQIGIVLLIGLSAKTSILIVEFAKVQRDSGMSVVDAAIEASRLRFRAVLMTAFSFILGVIPLLVATGAGAASRVTLGTTVFGGMVAATLINVVAVPMLYCVIQRASDKVRGIPADAPRGPAPQAAMGAAHAPDPPAPPLER